MTALSTPSSRTAPAQAASPPFVESLVIRPAESSDSEALRRLAVLDSGQVPAGELLIAEASGELRAALSISEGTYIADPFERTRDIVALLDTRAAALRARLPRRERGQARLALWAGMWSRAAHLHPSQ